jgi:hypothetical protein
MCRCVSSPASPFLSLLTQSHSLTQFIFVLLATRHDTQIVPDAQRLHFDVRAFAKQYGLNGALGGGAHMWREVWDKYVGAVYRYELRECPSLAIFALLFLEFYE